MKFQSLFTTCFFVFLSIAAFSQTTEDWLVTSRGDTLRGKIKIISFDVDQVQITVDKKKKTLPATQVKTLRLNNEIYATQRRLNGYFIMKLVKQGYMSIYAYREGNQTRYENIYLTKRDGKYTDLPNLTFKKSMVGFLDECSDVRDQVRNGTLTRKDYEKIVDFYNVCIDENSIAKAKKTAPLNLTAVDALTALQKKLEGAADFDNKKNAIDLLSDIREKMVSSQSVPPYQLEALKSYLGNNNDVKEEFTQFINTLGSH